MTIFYDIGTVTTVQNSKIVTGALTGWAAALIVGGRLIIANKVYSIESIDSDTQLTLRNPFPDAGGSGLAYEIDRVSDAELQLSKNSQSLAELLDNWRDEELHSANQNNPHNVTKAQVGLGSVNNTPDVDKPVSTLQQAAIDDAVANIPTAPISGFRNKIINGGFDVWQRATASSVHGYNSADRWLFNMAYVTGTISVGNHVVGQTDVPGNPTHFSRFDVSVFSTEFWQAQFIENVRTLAGKKATLTFYARASSAVTSSPLIGQNFGVGGSATIHTVLAPVNITTEWQRFDLVIDIDSVSGKGIGANSRVELYPIRVTSQFTGHIDISRVSFVEGDATNEADPFAPRQIGQELALCQRYYCKVGMTISPDAVPYANTAFFPVEMRSTPSASLVAGGVNGASVTSIAYSPTIGIRQLTAASGWVDALFGCDAEL